MTKIHGFEGEADAQFGHLSIDGGISVLHSELGQIYAVDPRLPAAVDPLTGLPLPCQPSSSPVSTTCISLGGRRQTYAPNFTFNAGAQYDCEIGTSGDEITPRVNFSHVGSQWATLFENPARGDRLRDRNVLAARLAWQHKTGPSRPMAPTSPTSITSQRCRADSILPVRHVNMA